jgi:sigma-B regulation protein RsbU (phosphoserine phosphatase)
MRIRTRFTLFTIVLLVAATLSTGFVSGYIMRDRVRAQALNEARVVAQLLSQAARKAIALPEDLEGTIGDLMVGHAKLTARYVAAAEKAGFSIDRMISELYDVTTSSPVSEFWVTDPDGNAYINTEEEEFHFTSDPERNPHSSMFWPLITGDRTLVIGKLGERDVGDGRYKYVAAAGVDKPRIVQVGLSALYFDEIAQAVGLKSTLDALIGTKRFKAVWAFDLAGTVITGAEQGEEADEDGKRTFRDPTDDERALALKSMNTVGVVTQTLGEVVYVAAPILSRLDAPAGSAVVQFSLAEVNDAVRQTWIVTAELTVAIALIGVVLASLAGRQMSRPIEAVSRAVREVERAHADAVDLSAVMGRTDEIGTLARSITAMATQVFQREDEMEALVMARTQDLATKNEALQQMHERIAEELRVAQYLQASMLPEEWSQQPDFQIQAMMEPAREVGGDFYDYFTIDHERIGIVIADVSGKGVPAAIFMAIARTTIQGLAATGNNPGRVMRDANEVLCGVNPLSLFVTVFYAVVNRRTGECVYANAGHNPPYTIRSGGEISPLPTTNGVALGVMEDLDYAEQSLTLGPGDSLFAFTDGFTEAFDVKGEEYGEDRLIQSLKPESGEGHLSARTVTERATGAVKVFTGEAEQSDDLTCLTLYFVGFSDASEQMNDQNLVVLVKNDLDEIGRLAEQVETFGELIGMSMKEIFEVNMSMDEIITNIISYGYDDDADHQIFVEITRDRKTLSILIEDDAKAFNPLADAPEVDTESSLEDRKIGGLGIHLVKTVMNDVTYSWRNGRNRLVMKKELAG